MMVGLVPLDDGDADPVASLLRAGAHREAVGLCARVHGGAVGRLCMAMLGNQAEAEETLQDTLLAAHAAMSSYRGEGTVRAWLFGIARRLCARRMVARLRREREVAYLVLAAPGEPADAALLVRQRAERVRAALERVSPTEREALLLRFEADLSFREIAAACDVDEATARKRASRGLARLREILAREGQDVS
jgi:RNA polymerase sigma-70 factor (ECF subfamily)